MFNPATWATISLVGLGALIAAPVLIKGFGRRGKGVFYEQNFLIQRAPQMATLGTVLLTVVGYLSYNSLLVDPSLQTVFSQGSLLGPVVSNVVSWLGVGILISGLVFMIGGWYSLGEMFSTDAEVMDNHTVRKVGMLKFVMHPAYSGIIQCVLGSALGAVCLPAAAMAVFLVAPLWLRRAKYEENLLMESLGPDYKKYAEELKWRRLIPSFIPIGV